MKQNISYLNQKIYKKGLTNPLTCGIINTSNEKGIDKMRIEDKRKKKNEVFFGELCIGDTFECDKCLWIKCGDDVALNLNCEEIDEFYSQTHVIEVNIVITIVD